MARDVSKYVVDGVRVPSVTEVLTLVGLVDFSHVDVDVLAAACKRGHEVHEWTELLDQGFITPDDTPDPAIAGYVESYLSFKEETGFAPEYIEQVVVCEKYRYAGMLDRTGKLNGREVLIDLKTGGRAPWWGLQLAGYAFALDRRGLDRFSLELQADGRTGKLVQHTDRHDFHDFLAAVRLTHWKLRLGGVSLDLSAEDF